MRQEEMDGLDLLVHLIDPDVVVEVGTNYGGSAWILSEHVPVVTVDHDPKHIPELFKDRPVTFLKGNSPEALDRVAPYIAEKRWLFFHDSGHNKQQLLAELAWAEKRGAVAAVWHDSALFEPCAEDVGSMLQALASLQKEGYRARRMQHFGVEEMIGYGLPAPDCFTGLGFTWFD